MKLNGNFVTLLVDVFILILLYYMLLPRFCKNKVAAVFQFSEKQNVAFASG